LHFADMISIVV